QLYILTFSLQFAACLALATLVVFISIILKNSMYTIFVSVAVLGVLYILGQFSSGKGILAYINSFNYAEFMKSSQLFEVFKAYNVFGYPMLYPNLLVAVFIVITIILMILIYKSYRNTQISH